MFFHAIGRQACRRLNLAILLVAALATVSFAGCGGDTGPDGTIKTEQGKSVQESVKTTRGPVKHDAAPLQRVKGGPD